MGTDGAGWNDAKRAILAALRAGRYINDVRSDRRRNQLAGGKVDVDTVIRAVEATRGSDARCANRCTAIRTFQPGS